MVGWGSSAPLAASSFSSSNRAPAPLEEVTGAVVRRDATEGSCHAHENPLSMARYKASTIMEAQ